MNFIKQIFPRANLSQISEFILYGQELCQADRRPYSEQIKEAYDIADATLEKFIKDPEEFEEADVKFNRVFGVYESVYTQIGLHAGAALVFELLRPFLWTTEE